MFAFVLEIGTEELPARFLANAEAELGQRFGAAMAEKGIEFSGLSVCSTPRRLALYIERVAGQSTMREEVITGPPLKAAYDVGGRPTPAVEGFARSQGVAVEALFNLDTEKGVYLAVRKSLGGEPALGILAAICPAVIAALPFPKRMHWGSDPFTFARPIRWILAMLGDQTVPFCLGVLQSGASTCGHRVHGPGPFTLANASSYFTVLREQGKVSCSAEERLKIITERGDRLGEDKQGRILWKESLLEEVSGLCEHPVALMGGFDPSFLEVPREVLLTSMESHQKSFGVESKDGRLLPYFLTVLNIAPQDEGEVRRGWERVLRARLEDARFFWKTDLETGFDAWLEALNSVIYLAPLGSMGDKSRRIESLCAWIAGNIAVPGGEKPIAAAAAADAALAGRLCKADLVSAMVKEFDTLQGVMGGIYALRAGKSAAAARAIAEQYLPAGPDSPVPSSLCGAILSMADKADTLVGCFGLGMIPTGAADPYALRRAALGIARILEEKGLRLDVSALFSAALAAYGDIRWKSEPDQFMHRLNDFFASRLKNYFTGKGAETLLVEAVLGADSADVKGAAGRLAALAEFARADDFGQAVLTFKRAANIIRKQGQEEGQAPLDGLYERALFQDEAEAALADEIERVAPVFNELWDKEAYGELFGLLRRLRPFVDAFFDQVMVMCKEEDLRRNRLNLLQALVSRLGRLADFSALQM